MNPNERELMNRLHKLPRETDVPEALDNRVLSSLKGSKIRNPKPFRLLPYLAIAACLALLIPLGYSMFIHEQELSSNDAKPANHPKQSGKIWGSQKQKPRGNHGPYDIKRTDQLSHMKVSSHVSLKSKGVNVVMKASYQKGNMTLVLNNMGSKKLYFSEAYTLEKKRDGQWYQTKFTDGRSFHLVAMFINPDKQHTQNVKLRMPRGTYRVIKSMSYQWGQRKEIKIGDTFTVQN